MLRWLRSFNETRRYGCIGCWGKEESSRPGILCGLICSYKYTSWDSESISQRMLRLAQVWGEWVVNGHLTLNPWLEVYKGKDSLRVVLFRLIEFYAQELSASHVFPCAAWVGLVRRDAFWINLRLQFAWRFPWLSLHRCLLGARSEYEPLWRFLIHAERWKWCYCYRVPLSEITAYGRQSRPPRVWHQGGCGGEMHPTNSCTCQRAPLGLSHAPRCPARWVRQAARSVAVTEKLKQRSVDVYFHDGILKYHLH